MESSEYINEQRREYSLYVLHSRALPSITDGLKNAQRRVLWTARDGKKHKTATLAGATMSIHPHQAPEGAINTSAAPYGNNIPLLQGDGAFGTLLNPTAYGAARYTSVHLSKFSKDVLLTDIELLPMVENYDGTLQEPAHFLPLVPIVLLNPSEGIAVGFASSILPRKIEDIIGDQISYLEGREPKERSVYISPLKQTGMSTDGKRWSFQGEYETINTTTLKITSLPFGTEHHKYVEFLIKLEDEGKIVNFTDYSQDHYNIVLKFKRGVIAELESKGKMVDLLKLSTNITENMNVLDFDGKYVLSSTYKQIIEDFTEWRLSWFKKRYKRLEKLLSIDIQKYKDIIKAIEINLGQVARKIKSRGELKEFCKESGIVHVDFIADLQVYRFTEEEKKKVEKKLSDAEKVMDRYRKILSNHKERVKIYIDELQDILKKYKKGEYSAS